MKGANSVVNYESASAIFERLRDLPSAPVDLRVEAGFKWGYALAKRALRVERLRLVVGDVGRRQLDAPAGQRPAVRRRIVRDPGR